MIGIITYDHPHRKTQDVLMKLILEGYSRLQLVVLPWRQRVNFKPIFLHRPSYAVDVSVEELSERLGISYTKVETHGLKKLFEKMKYRHIVIAGAGILPQEAVSSCKIINAHPGFLPYAKGLDALKWSIFYDHPIGVTTHYISENTDEGLLIERRAVPVFFEDSFHSLAYRVYETEIEMLVNSIELIDKGLASMERLDDATHEAKRRMPHNYELVMMERFKELRKRANPL